MKTKMFGFLVVGAMFLALTGFSSQSDAGVNVGIGINIPTVGLVLISLRTPLPRLLPL